MKVIQLDVFLRKYLDISDPSGNPDNSVSQEAIHKAYRSRSREVLMRKYLLPQLVRPLDAGFARSTTVHPDTARALYNICYASNVRNVFAAGTGGNHVAYLHFAVGDDHAVDQQLHQLALLFESGVLQAAPHAGAEILNGTCNASELHTLVRLESVVDSPEMPTLVLFALDRAVCVRTPSPRACFHLKSKRILASASASEQSSWYSRSMANTTTEGGMDGLPLGESL
jgi:hypothetical protein